MKKLLFTALIFIFNISIYSQDRKIEISQPVFEKTSVASFDYCRIVATNFEGKTQGKIDYGQKITLSSGWESIVDDKKEPIIFNSVIDLLNYMSSFGWELVCIEPTTKGFYYLKRAKKQ